MTPADEPVSDPLVAELEALLRVPPDDLGAAARDLVARACDDEVDGGRHRVLTLIDHLEGRAFDVSRALAIRGPEEARLIGRALDILDAIRDVGLDRLGETPGDVLSEVDREEKWLAAVARYPDPWTRQLVTLRAVQTLCVLDILNARRVVTELGGYSD